MYELVNVGLGGRWRSGVVVSGGLPNRDPARVKKDIP